jgi:ammonium transporter, Amt family
MRSPTRRALRKWCHRGFLWAKGALDFAGGTVVHINAGVAGLVGAFLIGKRIGYGREAMTPHSLTLTMIGASCCGWAGSASTPAPTSKPAAWLHWRSSTPWWRRCARCPGCWRMDVQGQALHAGCGFRCVAGLVAITPACGFVGPMGAIVIGLLAGVVCLWGVNGLKKLLGADDRSTCSACMAWAASSVPS